MPADRVAEEDNQEDAEEHARRASLLRRNTMRSLSRGISVKDRKSITGHPTFHEMTYEVSESIKSLKRPPTMPRNTKGPQATHTDHLLQRLEKPKRDSVWDRQNVQDCGNVVTLDIVSDRSISPHMNWALGQEHSGSKDGSAIKAKPEGGGRIIKWPKDFTYTPTVSRRTLDCETAERSYCPIDLSALPCGGFSHTELLINSLPTLGRDDVKHLISMKTRQVNHLGAVSTAHDIPGLIVHRIRSRHYDILVNILDMHTRLQVHSFVPRTFALHAVIDDRKPNECVGVFVGESPGSMNLGQSDGVLMSTTYDDALTFTYHVLQCLLRVQMLSLRVLGFTMRRIQPARIWRVDEGFRVDMLGCLMDTLYMWKDEHPKRGGWEGLASVWHTLTQLRVHQHVPEAIAKVLRKAYHEETVGMLTVSPRKPNVRRGATTTSRVSVDIHRNAEPCAARSPLDDKEMLLRVYDLCDFPDSTVHRSERWDILGLNGEYKELLLPINNGHTVHPYGPFFIQIHNQVIKWNRAIVVEPLTTELSFDAHLDPNLYFTDDVLARALLDTFTSNHRPEQRECFGSMAGSVDVVRDANEALRRATEDEDSCHSSYYTCWE